MGFQGRLVGWLHSGSMSFAGKYKTNETLERLFHWNVCNKDIIKYLPEEQKHKPLLKGTFEGLCPIFGASN